MRKHVIYDHLHKTAGTTIRSAFQRLLGEKKVSSLLQTQPIEFANKLTAKFDFVSGHLLLSPEYSWPESLYHMTVLRHPVERFLSHYSYVRETPEATEPFALLAKAHDVSTLLESKHPDAACMAEHFYASHFMQALYPKDVVASRIVRGDVPLNEIITFMESNYDLIGISEFIPMTIHVLAFQNGLRWRGYPETARKTAKRAQMEQLSQAARKILLDYTAVDQEIYEHARRLFFLAAAELTSWAAGQRRTADASRHAPESPRLEAAPITDLYAEMICSEPGRHPWPVVGADAYFFLRFRPKHAISRFWLEIIVYNEFKQIVYRRPSVFTPDDPQHGEIEIMWKFRCALGEGTYTCGLAYEGVDEEGAHHYFADNIYDFIVQRSLTVCSAGILELFPDVHVRLEPASPDVEGRVEFKCASMLTSCGTHLRCQVRAENTGKNIWNNIGVHRVALGYCICSVETGESRTHGEIHTFLPREVTPSETVDIDLNIIAPDNPGHYYLYPALVQERRRWFFIGDAPLILEVKRIDDMASGGAESEIPLIGPQ